MSLDTVELVMSWEEIFGIQIPNNVAASLTTPLEARDTIGSLLGEKGETLDLIEIDTRIKEAVLEISGMPDSEYSLNGRFVEDFGID